MKPVFLVKWLKKTIIRNIRDTYEDSFMWMATLNGPKQITFWVDLSSQILNYLQTNN